MFRPHGGVACARADQGRPAFRRPFDHRSTFDCRIAAETTLAGRKAIVPQISGRGWITGTHQVMLDPDDPGPPDTA
jgi:proline racemase